MRRHLFLTLGLGEHSHHRIRRAFAETQLSCCRYRAFLFPALNNITAKKNGDGSIAIQGIVTAILAWASLAVR